MKFQVVLLSVLFSITTSYSQDKENTMSSDIVIISGLLYDIVPNILIYSLNRPVVNYSFCIYINPKFKNQKQF